MPPTLKQLRAKLLASQPAVVVPPTLSLSQQADLTTINDSKLFNAQKPHWHRHFTCPTATIKTHRKQTIKGLVSDLNNSKAMDIAFDIFNCSKSKPCRSPFCPYCRYNIQDNAATTCHQLFSNSPAKDLCFLTVLLPVTYHPQNDVSKIIQSCRKSISSIFNYRNYTDIVLSGFFEVDIKIPALVKNKPRSLEVLTALDFDEFNNQPAYLVHFHALVDLKGHSKAAFRKSLVRTFNKIYQIRLSALHSKSSKNDNIKNIARYMLKFRTQHANNLFGNQVTGKATYGKFFGNNMLRSYVTLVHSLLVQNNISSLSINKNVP